MVEGEKLFFSFPPNIHEHHSGRPEHLLTKEALVKQATSLRGLCEAHVHLGLGEE